MKHKILILLIILLYGVIINNSILGQTYSQYNHFEKLLKNKSYKDLAVFLKDGLKENDNRDNYRSLSYNNKFLLNTNANFFLTEEITEITPPWADPSKDKNEFSYDEKGNNSQIIRSVWQNNDWVVQGRGNLTFDEFNREIELINQSWMNSKWENWFKQTTTYHSSGQILERVGYFYNNGNWKSSWRETNTYDENDNMIKRLFEWSDGNNWEESSLSEYTYDENNSLSEELYLYNDNGTWVNASMFIYYYDAAGNNNKVLERMWNGSSWDDYYNRELSYNEQNKILNILGYLLEGENWRNNTRYTYSYDENQNNSEYMFEQNWDGSGWQIFEKTTRTFSENVTEVDYVELALPETFSLNQNYPNPFNPSTTINYSIPIQSDVTLKVFNVLGKEIITLVNENQSPGNYKVSFNTSTSGLNLVSGVYFYTITANDFIETRKMILLK